MARPSLTYRLALLCARPAVRVLFRPLVVGLEHVPPGGIVLAANHLSGFDVLALSLPLRGRWLRHMAKAQLFAHPLAGPLVRAFGAFPARGDGPAGSSVERAAALARGGDVVVILPEGARRRRDRVHRPKSGAARAALAAGVPLVPAAIRGTDRWRRLGRWQTAFGVPVELGDLPADRVAAVRAATDRLWSAIVELERGLAEAPDRRRGVGDP